MRSVQTTAHPDLPATKATVLTVGTDDAAIAAKKENQRAFAYLTMAMGHAQFIGIINQAKTREWPSGLAWKFMERFHHKYRPDDRVTGIEVSRLLDKLKMSKDKNPEDFFEDMEVIRNCAPSYDVPEDQLIALVLKKAPKAYASVLSAEQGANLKTEHLEEAMYDHFRLLSCSKGEDDEDEDKDSEDEVTLAARPRTPRLVPRYLRSLWYLWTQGG